MFENDVSEKRGQSNADYLKEKDLDNSLNLSAMTVTSRYRHKN